MNPFSTMLSALQATPKKRLAIMQPYFFPYLGYFQLIQAVDQFVIYDDVNYIKRGWINRNVVLSHTGKQLITLSIQGASQNKLINEVKIGNNQHKLVKTIRQNYCKAPQFPVVFPLLEEIIFRKEENLANYLDYQLRCICDYLEISPEWHVSSRLNKDNQLRGQDKVLAICKELGATHYINLPGGKLLYDVELFASCGIQLFFIKPKLTPYRQFGKEFIPHLSIIDIMMWNSVEDIREIFLKNFLILDKKNLT